MTKRMSLVMTVISAMLAASPVLGQNTVTTPGNGKQYSNIFQLNIDRQLWLYDQPDHWVELGLFNESKLLYQRSGRKLDHRWASQQSTLRERPNPLHRFPLR
jgi:hypothetical protein